MILGSWFEPGDVIQRIIESVQGGLVSTRTPGSGTGCACRTPAGPSPSKQQAFLDLTDGKITLAARAVLRLRSPSQKPMPRLPPGWTNAQPGRKRSITGKAVISLTTGWKTAKVTVAFLVAVGAAESGLPTPTFKAKEGGLAGRWRAWRPQ